MSGWIFGMEILERADQLGQLHDYLRQAGAGEGKLVLLGGEAGIGKTTLVERFVREAGQAVPSARVEIVSCDCLKMPGPLGSLFEIAQVLGPEVQRLLAEEAPRDRLFRAVLAALAEMRQPLILVGEDAHWTDEASIDLIRFIGRRIGGLRLLFVITYRDDELGPYHPLRRILGDLATAPAVRRMTLMPFSPAAVSELALGSGIDPGELHARTGGNPFFVTEVLASLASGTPEVPATVRDAVLARASRLSLEARAVLDAAAVIGEQVEPALLEAVVGGPIEDAVDECLAVGTFRPLERTIAFRHGITRLTMLETISPPRYRALHRRILGALRADADFRGDLARLAHHAEEAGDRETVLAAAPAAARQAAAFGAHREAAVQYARALRHAAELPPEQRADLFEARSRECYLTGDVEEAVDAAQEAVALWRGIGDRVKEGDGLRRLSRVVWFAGRNVEAERLASDALTMLESFPPGPELAMAYCNLSQLRMLAYDLPAAIEWGERAITLASELGERATLVSALTNVGAARIYQEDESGRALLERSLELARKEGLEDDVSRALGSLSSTAFIQCRLQEAERYVLEGLRHTGERDLLAMERYFRAQHTAVLFAQGIWDAAASAAEATIQDPAATTVTRIVALWALGRVQACRGENPWPVLDEALALAEMTGELQRLTPIRVARAEAAWLAGNDDQSAGEVAGVLESAALRANRWRAGELAIWLHRSGRPPLPGVELAEPYALEIRGDWAAAADYWEHRGYPLYAARARGEAGDEAAVRAALATFERLGARPDAARATRRLRALGARRIPRGPNRATRGNPGLLSNREVEVLILLAAGKSNREIAQQLYLSPKTAGHHVSAILTKLGFASRSEAADHAHRIGLLPLRDRDAGTKN